MGEESKDEEQSSDEETHSAAQWYPLVQRNWPIKEANPLRGTLTPLYDIHIRKNSKTSSDARPAKSH
jgi:hypothetical protein